MLLSNGVLLSAGFTDKGPVRKTNEDHFAIDHELRFCVVADGMGGHKAGEVASTLAVSSILDYLHAPHRAGWPYGFVPSLSEPANLLRNAIYLANIRLLEKAESCSDLAGMGTTIVATFVADDRVSIGHVGDSRVYHYAGRQLTRLTEDDSWIASYLADNPDTDPVTLKNHPMRNVLTNVVGATTCTDVHVFETPLEDGDMLLLTTDGVHGVLNDDQLERLLGEAVWEPKALAEELVHAALDHGSRDNCTAVVTTYSKK